MSSSETTEAMSQLMAITGADEQIARTLVETCENNVQMAEAMFYDSNLQNGQTPSPNAEASSSASVPPLNIEDDDSSSRPIVDEDDDSSSRPIVDEEDEALNSASAASPQDMGEQVVELEPEEPSKPADIFGDSESESDDEFEGFESRPESHLELDELHKILNQDDDDDSDEEGPVAGPSQPKPVVEKADSEIESEDEERHQSSGMVYDFDIMLQKKKAQSRRRKKKAGDIINDDDDIVAALLNDMKKAAEEDFRANKQKVPSMNKLKMLNVAAANLMKIDYRESLLDSGVLHAIATWLSVMPDGSMPCLKIRTTMLNILTYLNTDDIDMIKSSGLGKVVMFMFKNPKETKENKIMAGKLITNWSKNIFNIETEGGANLREEREKRDHEAYQLKRRATANDSIPDPKRVKDDALAQLRPGEKGWIPRARVPAPSMKDYVVRPESKIDIDLSKSGTKKEISRLDKHIRAFKEKKKHNKTGRMFTVSIEGRKM